MKVNLTPIFSHCAKQLITNTLRGGGFLLTFLTLSLMAPSVSWGQPVNIHRFEIFQDYYYVPASQQAPVHEFSFTCDCENLLVPKDDLIVTIPTAPNMIFTAPPEIIAYDQVTGKGKIRIEYGNTYPNFTFLWQTIQVEAIGDNQSITDSYTFPIFCEGNGNQNTSGDQYRKKIGSPDTITYINASNYASIFDSPHNRYDVIGDLFFLEGNSSVPDYALKGDFRVLGRRVGDSVKPRITVGTGAVVNFAPYIKDNTLQNTLFYGSYWFGQWEGFVVQSTGVLKHLFQPLSSTQKTKTEIINAHLAVDCEDGSEVELEHMNILKCYQGIRSSTLGLRLLKNTLIKTEKGTMMAPNIGQFVENFGPNYEHNVGLYHYGNYGIKFINGVDATVLNTWRGTSNKFSPRIEGFLTGIEIQTPNVSSTPTIGSDYTFKDLDIKSVVNCIYGTIEPQSSSNGRFRLENCQLEIQEFQPDDGQNAMSYADNALGEAMNRVISGIPEDNAIGVYDTKPSRVALKVNSVNLQFDNCTFKGSRRFDLPAIGIYAERITLTNSLISGFDFGLDLRNTVNIEGNDFRYNKYHIYFNPQLSEDYNGTSPSTGYLTLSAGKISCNSFDRPIIWNGGVVGDYSERIYGIYFSGYTQNINQLTLQVIDPNNPGTPIGCHNYFPFKIHPDVQGKPLEVTQMGVPLDINTTPGYSSPNNWFSFFNNTDNLNVNYHHLRNEFVGTHHTTASGVNHYSLTDYFYHPTGYNPPSSINLQFFTRTYGCSMPGVDYNTLTYGRRGIINSLRDNSASKDDLNVPEFFVDLSGKQFNSSFELLPKGIYLHVKGRQRSLISK